MKLIELIYRTALSIFEFIIDALIIFITIVIINELFGENIFSKSISLLIIFCGVIYSINDAIEVFKENKLNK